MAIVLSGGAVLTVNGADEFRCPDIEAGIGRLEITESWNMATAHHNF